MIPLEVNGVRYTPEVGSIIIEAYGEKERLFLDEDAKDFCVGEYGDGCGGGRIFVLYDTYIMVYDTESGEQMRLLEDFSQGQSIDKKGCELLIQTQTEAIRFNLSSMERQK